jgi:uncharacterized RDD family membrane protein YckC
VNEHELSVVPVEARPYQGVTAGVATRLAANTIDTVVVGALMLGSYVGFAAMVFLVNPRTFAWPDFSPVLSVVGFLFVSVLYLTGAWWINGQTIGDRVMGVRVVSRGERRLRVVRAFARAVFCAFFPVGLMWCAVSPRRLSVQDLVLRTLVVYDWRPRATSVAPRYPVGE